MLFACLQSEYTDALISEPSLEGYHLLPTVRGDLLAKLGRFEEARPEFERAEALTCNVRGRELLCERAGGSTLAEPRWTKREIFALGAHALLERTHTGPRGRAPAADLSSLVPRVL